MKIGVTGGAGFIGVNFCLSALRRGYDVVAIDSFTYAANPPSMLQNLNVDIREVDIRQYEQFAESIKDCDLVVHFAAESHNDNSLSDPKLFLKTNVFGTYNVIQACLDQRKRLHHVSTDEVFGDFAVGTKESFHEESPYNPSSPYSATKAASDHLVRAWVRSYGLSATLSNSSNNFGPFQHEEKLIPSIIKSLVNEEKPRIYGDGTNVRDWLYVEDHVDGIWRILERGAIGGTYLLGTTNEMSNISLAQRILEIMDMPSDFFQLVEDRPGHDRRYSINPSKANSQLDWNPQSDFIEKLELTVEWYKERFIDYSD